MDLIVTPATNIFNPQICWGLKTLYRREGRKQINDKASPLLFLENILVIAEEPTCC